MSREVTYLAREKDFQNVLFQAAAVGVRWEAPTGRGWGAEAAPWLLPGYGDAAGTRARELLAADGAERLLCSCSESLMNLPFSDNLCVF